MKLKITALFAAIGLALGGFAAPANATIVKSTVKISVPAALSAGSSNPVDVSVCSLASASGTVCEETDERNVSLLADGKLVANSTTHNGIASFFWTPIKASKVKLSAKVAAKGTLKALQSEVIAVTVGKKLAVTAIATKYCTSDGCGGGAPESVAFDDESASLNVLIGSNAALAKSRDLKLQYMDTSHQWSTQSSGKSVWDADAKQYGYAFPLTLSSSDYCDNGDETYDWTYRVLVPGNAKSATAVSGLLEMRFDCGGTASAGPSSISLDVAFEDQSVDSTAFYPATFAISVADPDEVGWTAYSFYCEDLCSSSDNWYKMDEYGSSGDADFELSSDWGLGTGLYQVRVVLFPEGGLERIDSEIWQVEQY